MIALRAEDVGKKYEIFQRPVDRLKEALWPGRRRWHRRGQDVPEQKRILEINPNHPVVAQLQRLADAEGREDEFKRWAQLLLMAPH